MSKIVRIGDTGATFLVNIPDLNQGNWDYNDDATAWDSYIGFLMFSRTECGPDFVNAFGDGRLTWDVQDLSANLYSNFFTFVRSGAPAQRRAATLQFTYTPVDGAEDYMNTKKDQLYLHVDGINTVDMEWQEVTLATCVEKITVGLMLPSEGVTAEQDHARCVGMQKEVGY